MQANSASIHALAAAGIASALGQAAVVVAVEKADFRFDQHLKGNLD